MLTSLALAAASLALSSAQAQALVYAYQVGGYDLAAVIYVESSGCRYTRNPRGPAALGCGQLHQETAETVAGRRLDQRILTLNWRYNIRLAGRALRARQREFGEAAGITCYELGAPRCRQLAKTAAGRRSLVSSPYLHQVHAAVRRLRHLPLDPD